MHERLAVHRIRVSSMRSREWPIPPRYPLLDASLTFSRFYRWSDLGLKRPFVRISIRARLNQVHHMITAAMATADRRFLASLSYRVAMRRWTASSRAGACRLRQLARGPLPALAGWVTEHQRGKAKNSSWFEQWDCALAAIAEDRMRRG